MKRSRKKWIGIAIFASVFALAAWHWGPGLFEAGEFAWYTSEDLRLGPYLPPVDEVEILLLGGLKRDENAPFLESGVSYYKILGTITLHGKDAEAIAQNWRYLPRNPLLQALCHNPIYALRFRKNGKLLLQTTICWHCSNYSISTTENPWTDVEFGFDSSSPISQALLASLKKYVPPRGILHK